MRLHRSYCPNLTIGRVELSADETHHLSNVLRCGRGDTVELFDGRGQVGLGTMEGVIRGRATVEVPEIRTCRYDVPLKLTLAVVLPKGQRPSFLVEKCTELGVAALWPIVASRGVVRSGENTIERWRRQSAEAAKQSRRNWLPEIREPMEFGALLDHLGLFGLAAMAHPGGDSVLLGSLLANRRAGDAILVAIGPEGGWTQSEVESAARAGAECCSLGPTILRTETAAVAACAIAAQGPGCFVRDT